MSRIGSSGDIKNKRRQTPYDRAVGNSIAEPVPERKEAFGKPTSMEMHANNFSPQEMERIIAYALTDNGVGDAPLLKVLVSAASEKGHRFDTIYADGAYSSNENWAYLCRDNRYRFVTSFKSNTVPKSNGCMARGEAAKLWCELPYREWVKVTGYGTRWKCECTFSDFKRLFPESLEAHTRRGMVREILSRVDAFNIYKRVRANLLGITRNGIDISI